MNGIRHRVAGMQSSMVWDVPPRMLLFFLYSLHQGLESGPSVLYLQQPVEQQRHVWKVKSAGFSSGADGGGGRCCGQCFSLTLSLFFLCLSLSVAGSFLSVLKPLLWDDSRWPPHHCQIVHTHWALLGCFPQVFILIITESGDRLKKRENKLMQMEEIKR